MSRRGRTKPTIAHLLGSLLAASTPLLAATDLPAANTGGAAQFSGPLQYIGDSGRVAIGYQRGGHFFGELYGLLHESADSAWLGEAWLADSAGGLKLSYHRGSSGTVAKYFAAIDQNDDKQRKVSLGAGLERDSWFGNLYLSAGLDHRKQVSSQARTVETREMGVDNGRPFLETTSTTTITQIFQRGFDHGVGLRFGHVLEEQGLRLSGGLDYEWGQDSAKLNNYVVALEKFFVGTPHSVALQFDHVRRQDEVRGKHSDNRAQISYRYSFGEKPTSRAETSYRMVEAPRTKLEPVVIPARQERKLVKTTVSMASDAFFDKDSAKLTVVARQELDRIVTVLKAQGREGNIRLVGSSCDLGPAPHNLALSLRRAQAVSDYLVAAGAAPADATVVEGLGEMAPKFPPKPATRAKNRRVDLEFVTLTEKVEEINIPVQTLPAVDAPVSYVREVIVQEPAWVRRALRTPASHKRTVDAYQTQEQSQNRTSRREFINRPPLTQGDSFSVDAGSSTSFDVLANDRDPDPGDSVTLVSVTQPDQGQASVQGGRIVYVAPAAYRGSASFNYTVRDNAGLLATGTVNVAVAFTSPTMQNRPPVLGDDQYLVSASRPTDLDVLVNDSDPDGDPLTISAVTQPFNGSGSVSIVGNRIRFSPTGFFVFDRFSYTVSDGRGGSSTATVSLVDP